MQVDQPTTTHTLAVRPAIVRENGKRYYFETDPTTAGVRTLLEAHRDEGSFCDVVVSRSPTRDHARLSFGVRGLGKVGPELTPYQMLRLAADLVSAAKDIEQNPTSKLRSSYRAGFQQAVSGIACAPADQTEGSAA